MDVQPATRTHDDQEALWRALELGDLQLISSDHAPYRYDDSGKLRAGPNPNFRQIANGLPGLEARLPLLFDAMVSKGRLGLAKFVELTSSAPAQFTTCRKRDRSRSETMPTSRSEIPTAKSRCRMR